MPNPIQSRPVHNAAVQNAPVRAEGPPPNAAAAQAPPAGQARDQAIDGVHARMSAGSAANTCAPASWQRAADGAARAYDQDGLDGLRRYLRRNPDAAITIARPGKRAADAASRR